MRSRSTGLFSGYPSAEARTALLSHSRPAATGQSKYDPALTPGQQLALLTVRHSALSREVVAKMRSSSVRASQHDYATIIARGLALKHASNRFLLVTYTGKLAADAIARALAKELNIHFFFMSHTRLHETVRCVCGWSSVFTASQFHVRAAQARWMARHLREVGEDKASVVAMTVPTSVTDGSVQDTRDEHA